MKLELKTENDNFLNAFSHFLSIFFKFALIIIFCDIAIKLGFISRHYQVHYNCKLLLVEKSKSNFTRLSKISNIKSKQNLWELCREVIK